MTFTVQRDELLKAIGHMYSVVERRSTVPVLGNIKTVATADGYVHFVATDMDICVEDKIKADVQSEFSTTIPALTFHEIVRKVPANQQICLTLLPDQEDTIQIQLPSSEFNLPIIPVSEFPSFESITEGVSFTIQSDVLKMLISKTKHAISNEETRYYLNGLYFHIVQDESGKAMLKVVATDGHRLAIAQTVAPQNSENMQGIILPKKAAYELLKLVESESSDVHVIVSKNRVSFKIGDCTLTTKIIDAKFPDYERVIPKNNDKILEIEKEKFAKSVDLVTSVSNDKTRFVKLVIMEDKIEIYASSEINNNAKGYEEIYTKCKTSGQMSICFNSKYIMDMISVVDGSDIIMTFSTEIGGAIAQDAADPNFTYILMPIQG